MCPQPKPSQLGVCDDLRSYTLQCSEHAQLISGRRTQLASRPSKSTTRRRWRLDPESAMAASDTWDDRGHTLRQTHLLTSFVVKAILFRDSVTQPPNLGSRSVHGRAPDGCSSASCPRRRRRRTRVPAFGCALTVTAEKRTVGCALGQAEAVLTDPPGPPAHTATLGSRASRDIEYNEFFAVLDFDILQNGVNILDGASALYFFDAQSGNKERNGA